MANTSSTEGGGQSRNRNRNRNRSGNRSQGRGGNRGGNSNRNRNRKSDGQSSGGGHRSGGYYREKVPRRAPKPSFWKRVLALFGLGGDQATAKPATAKSEASAEAGAAGSADRARRTPRNKAATTDDRPAPKKRERAARPPEKVEVTGPRLYVGNLSYETTEEDLEELFNGVGNVESAEVVTHKQSQRSKGYAFVVLRSLEEAKRAVDVLHDKDFMGRKLVVSGAKSVGPVASNSPDSGDDSTAAA